MEAGHEPLRIAPGGRDRRVSLGPGAGAFVVSDPECIGRPHLG